MADAVDKACNVAVVFTVVGGYVSYAMASVGAISVEFLDVFD